ncbi:hypothetical protein DBR47_22220 [Paucibacter sp. KBW04]|uniref:hypothetical protein n=1 Tax=Paucibacter sp. KBW04 TaxID=2153361 RepID=UPI000F58E973|nr:hypothetical protein [Paucibacter sp. KBW04]RQO54785.1 hypothetical protein DBR47_22220 [Paucibacter sp. KBW04]
MKPKPQEQAQIERLLRSLNEWAALQDPQLDDSGEIGARVRALIEELAGLGQAVTLRDGRYVPVTTPIVPDAGAKP